MNEFLNSLGPFGGAFVVFSLCVLWSACKYIFEEIKDYLTRPRYPVCSQEELELIYKEASEFVQSKHRPWDYDDGFAEYLWICHELSKDRSYLK
ncbi:hypothetical protein OAE31_02910 [Gammaproteobacteria bacterium]|nr:hypothetical protein [Gammaproteobacteria bacterium]